ncbi:hypothetical protein EDD22DRAFT_1007099 [Suillus occidentalis]|nr:hypothetical protein EDD22DRAFT_1007099 [Suillus occidentalis]
MYGRFPRILGKGDFTSDKLSVDAGTTSADVTMSSHLELTSSLLVSSTSSETSGSIPTSQSTSTTSSVSSSSHTPTSTSAPTTTTTATATATATTPSSSPSPSSISQNNLAPTSPTSTNDGLTTSTITSFFVTVIGSSSIRSTTLIPTVISSSYYRRKRSHCRYRWLRDRWRPTHYPCSLYFSTANVSASNSSTSWTLSASAEDKPVSEQHCSQARTSRTLTKQYALCEKLEADLLALNINSGSGPREEGGENSPIFEWKACF